MLGKSFLTSVVYWYVTTSVLTSAFCFESVKLWNREKLHLRCHMPVISVFCLLFAAQWRFTQIGNCSFSSCPPQPPLTRFLPMTNTAQSLHKLKIQKIQNNSPLQCLTNKLTLQWYSFYSMLFL